MHQLVLDTNVLVAGLRSKRGASYQLIRWFYDGRFKLKISVALALEYEDVLKRPGLLPSIGKQQIEDFIDYFLLAGDLEPSVPRLRPTLRDPDDERILELAVQCGAIIVTHNTKDFEGAARFGVKVRTPAEILTVLEGRTLASASTYRRSFMIRLEPSLKLTTCPWNKSSRRPLRTNLRLGSDYENERPAVTGRSF